MRNKRINKVLAALLIFQWLFVQFISNYPSFIEKFYSKGIYVYISKILRALFGWLPFSFGDVLYVFVGFLILKGILRFIRYRRLNIYKLLAKVSVVYFCFHLFWGFNYFRQPLHESLELNALDYSTEELNEFTQVLVKQINTIQLEITANDTIKVTIPYSRKVIYDKVTDGYQNLSANYPEYTYAISSIKHSLISTPLTYMGFSGYLNPFTAEAQVNKLNPLVSTPITSSHEVAHQLGYAAENEANFIGFLAALSNDDIYFKYSATYMALRYCLNDLYRHDKELYSLAIAELNKGTKKNMRESYEFWNSYQNPFEVYFKQLFNQYLKANKQTQGIKSYSLMVGMLINYEKQHHFIESK